MKKIILSLASILFSIMLLAQNETDALRYSFLNYEGTSRFVSMGGAFSSLGADFSTLSVNPAGIGVYKSSEMMIAPKINFAKAESNYYGNRSEDSKVNLSLSNIGLVFTGNVANNTSTPEWKNIQFGIGFNRVADFNNSMIMSGSNPDNSILDVYRSYANGNDCNSLNSFDTDLAWESWLLDTVPGDPFSYIKAHEGGNYQQKSTVTSGGITEMVLSLGGNYNDKLYLGATMGFSFLNYDENSYYKEIDVDNSTNDLFEQLSINDAVNTSGSGFNFKLGAIYRITDWARISAAFHTPTYYSMHDSYSRVIKSEFETAKYENSSPQGKYNYKMTTPMRLIGGLAFIVNKKGIISADYEMVDYSQARFRSKDPEYDFLDVNEKIMNTYNVSHNFKIGTEWVFQPFSIRAGFSYLASPYKNKLNDMSTPSIHAGFGIREKFYFIDFAYVYSFQKSNYYMYNPDIIENLGMTLSPVNNDINKSCFLVTLGLRFSEM